VTDKGTARRYAGALFEVVSKSGDPARAGRDLKAVSTLFSDHADLQRALTSPAVPASRKRAVLVSVLQAAGGVGPEVTRMLELMAERDRLALVADTAAAFDERTREADRVVPAEVVTAVPLSDAQRASLQAAIAKAAGLDVALSARVDPAIIGGVVARVGSIVFDGSVTRQLERLKQQLTDAQ
jgi:F-type H+-transporting ATPase subunit delta